MKLNSQQFMWISKQWIHIFKQPKQINDYSELSGELDSQKQQQRTVLHDLLSGKTKQLHSVQPEHLGSMSSPRSTNLLKCNYSSEGPKYQ